jgi:hypothetical protein
VLGDKLGGASPLAMRLEWLRAAILAARNAVVGGNLSSLRLIRHPRNGRVSGGGAGLFEIGTLNGYSAFHFTLNTPPDATVFTLDLPPGEVALAFEPTLLRHDDISDDEVDRGPRVGEDFERLGSAGRRCKPETPRRPTTGK